MNIQTRTHPVFGVEVSQDGRIYRNGKELHQNIGHYGYRRVFAVSGRTTYVHRLVAECWCDGQEEGLVVNHKDGDVSNNAADNLEWVTLAQNSRHGHLSRYKTVPEHAKVSATRKKHSFVMQIEEDEWMSFVLAARRRGFTTTAAWARSLLKADADAAT
ncbi:HNH endonuclease [Rhizobium leguminosarum]|uniref:HNH endonuclease n=1 Tax=Rhizobium leguminosarum TaxID=384 RepID=UPI0010320A39|nr:HNH endonuclease [Rhizobium leguminosarum]TBH23624.1 HNH endonuclease [Rhizobium leguminosarum]